MKQGTFQPLRTKLLKNNLLSVIAAFIIFGGVVSYALNSLSKSFIELSGKRSETERDNLEKVSNENIRKITELYETTLKDKGKKLIAKDSTSLVPMVEDNAFGQLRDFIKKNFRDDAEIIASSFFTEELGDIKAWQVVNRQYPNGLNIPIEYDSKIKAWKATSEKHHRVTVPDAEVGEYLRLKTPLVEMKKILLPDKDGNMTLTHVFDCVTPVRNKKQQIIGHLRYVLSLEPMERSIQEEKKTLEQKLVALKSENETANHDLNKIVSSSINSSILVLVICALSVIFLSYLLSFWFSEGVARPVKQLTKIAQSMEAGHYQQEIKVVSNDEIGLLAHSFGEMSRAILKRDEEVRTAERKLSEIFESVPLGIFAIGNDNLIEPRYSSYTEWLLNTNVVKGETLKSLLFSKIFDQLNVDQQNCLNTLNDLFGKSDMHFSVAKLFLPSEIAFPLPPDHPDKVRHIALTYQPIFHDELIHRLLVVMEDKSAVVRAQKEATESRIHEDKSVMRLLQIKRASTDTMHTLMGELRVFFQKIEEAAKEKKTSDLRALLHSIKGSSRIIGLDFLSEIIQSLEVKVKLDDDKGKELDWAFLENGIHLAQKEWIECQFLYYALFPEYSVSLSMKRASSINLASLRDTLFLRVAKTAKLKTKKIELKVNLPNLEVSEKFGVAVSECLAHLMNNAIAHGIKGDSGTIWVDTKQIGDQLEFDVRDDGVGIQIDLVKRKAVERKIIDEARAKSMSDEEARTLIFASGLSTSSTVDKVSGMGIGLDAVKGNVEALGGVIKISENKPQGTRFQFALRIS